MAPAPGNDPEDNRKTLPAVDSAAPREEPGVAARAPADPAGEDAGTMIPARTSRLRGESVLMRLVATAGIVGIGVAIAAILASQHVQGWIVGLAVSLWSVVFAAFLWSSRRM